MVVKQYIKDFEAMEFGMFVHFGIYSVLGRGERIWSRNCRLTKEETAIE